MIDSFLHRQDSHLLILTLLPLLNNKSSQVRKASIEALHYLHDPQLLAHLMPLLTDPDMVSVPRSNQNITRGR